MLVCDNSQSFETPRIKNHGAPAPSAQIFFGGGDAQIFDTSKNTITVSLQQVDIELGGVADIRLPRKGKHSGDIEGSFHVSTLEFEGVHHLGRAGTTTAVCPMLDAYASIQYF